MSNGTTGETKEELEKELKDEDKKAGEGKSDDEAAGEGKSDDEKAGEDYSDDPRRKKFTTIHGD